MEYPEESFPMHLPCGGVARFDFDSGISYRCERCYAVVGSIGQPRECREEAKKWEAYEKAGMWRWDYDTGKPYSKKEKNVDSKCLIK
jgi:hypothetical protein